MMFRRAATAVVASTICVLAVPSAALGAAQPPGNDKWITLEGTCGGQPATLLDPQGGNTAFLVGGSVGVGKIFTWLNAADPDMVLQTVVNGRGVDPARLVTCEFLFPDVEWPGLGVINVILQVQALMTPQGR
jgi:hypothetical protein